MADVKVKETVKDTVTVNLRNPTRARRIIHDGINVEGAQQKQFVIEANGGIKENVTLHKDIVSELRERNRVKKDSDLQVLPLKAPTEPVAEPAPAA